MSRSPVAAACLGGLAQPGCRRWPGARDDESGVATLAVVLVIPAVLFLVSTVAQLAVYYHASHLATAAAQEAARAAQLADGSEQSARAYGEDFLAQAGPNLVLEPQVLVTRDVVAEVVTVEVLGRAPQVMPGMAMQISASATGPLERFEPAP